MDNLGRHDKDGQPQDIPESSATQQLIRSIKTWKFGKGVLGAQFLHQVSSEALGKSIWYSILALSSTLQYKVWLLRYHNAVSALASLLSPQSPVKSSIGRS